MVVAEIPIDEENRLRDLFSYQILDSAADADFDNLVALATEIYACPISLITFIDEERQWFKAHRGLDIQETPRNVSFCAHTILGSEVMVVNDTSTDERFHDNPFVIAEPCVRFYAGAPIISRAGYTLGTICVIDDKPRDFSLTERKVLSLMAEQVRGLMELKHDNAAAYHHNAIIEFMEETEATMKRISHQLHENIAQQVASCNMFLKMAADHPERSDTLMHAVREQLAETLLQVCNLSYSVTPQIKPWMDTGEMISSRIREIDSAFPFAIKLTTNKNSHHCENVIVLTVLRVAEQWLRRLAMKKDVSIVHIDVLMDKLLEISIFDDGVLTPIERGREVAEHILIDRLQTFLGDIDVKVFEGRNRLRIWVPAGLDGK